MGEPSSADEETQGLAWEEIEKKSFSLLEWGRGFMRKAGRHGKKKVRKTASSQSDSDDSDDGDAKEMINKEMVEMSRAFPIPDGKSAEPVEFYRGNANLMGLSQMNQRQLLRTRANFVLFACVSTVIITAVLVFTFSGASGLYRSEFNFTQAGAETIAKMDLTIDPCDDFVGYSCGTFLKNLQLPPEVQYYVQGFTSVAWEVDAEIASVLDSNWPMLDSYRRSCLNESAMNRKGTTPIAASILRIATANSLKSLLNIAAQLRAESGIDLSLFYGLYISPDEVNINLNAVKLIQTGFNLPTKDSYQDSALLVQYSEWINTMFLAANLRLTQDQIFELVTIEKELASYAQNYWVGPQLTYNPMNSRQLGSLMGSELASYVGALNLNNSNYLYIVEDPFYISHISPVLNNHTLVSLRYYAILRLFMSTYSMLGSDQRTAILGLKSILYGYSAQESSSRERTCQKLIRSNLGMLISHYWAQEHYSISKKQTVTALVENIRQAYITMMNDTDVEETAWMDPQTRKNIIQKFQMMQMDIGIPDEWSNPEDLLMKIGVIGFSGDFLENTLNLQRSIDLDNLKSVGPTNTQRKTSLVSGTHYMRASQVLRQRPDSKLTLHWVKLVNQIPEFGVSPFDWDMVPTDVNAYWDRFNQVVLPAAIQRAPFFDERYPDVQNLASLGEIMAHEMSHSMDPYGCQYNASGSLSTIISPESLENYQTIAECLAQRYSSYTEDSEHVNGELDIGEIFADFWAHWVTSEAIDKIRSIDLSRTQEQDKAIEDAYGITWDKLRFVSYAQLFCSKIDPTYMKNGVLTDSHPPPELRVYGTFSNNPQFATVFNCPLGSNYNPTSQCRFARSP